MTSEFFAFNSNMKKLEIKIDSLDLLRSLNGPVCVVAICGRSEAGKTSLLNQLVARLCGPMGCAEGTSAQQHAVGTSCRFSGGTLKHCLKGVWQWTRPSEWKLPYGQTYHVLLLDAEAIGASEQASAYSNHIFNLVVLLSSVLLYHHMGSIDDQSVDDLARFCEFARPLGEEAGIGAVPLDLSPSLLWLLRGFQMHIASDGKQLTYREYVEERLEPLPGRTADVRAKNQARARIKALFRVRDCHVLPLYAEALLARTDPLPVSELRAFQGLDSLVALLQSRCQPKRLSGRPVTGPMLAGLIEAYCRDINERRVPDVVSIWQRMAVLQTSTQPSKGAEVLYGDHRVPATLLDAQWRRELETAKAEAAAARGALAAAEKEAAALREQLAAVREQLVAVRAELHGRTDGLGLERLQFELAVATAQRQAAEEAAERMRTFAAQQLVARRAEVARSPNVGGPGRLQPPTSSLAVPVVASPVQLGKAPASGAKGAAIAGAGTAMEAARAPVRGRGPAATAATAAAGVDEVGRSGRPTSVSAATHMRPLKSGGKRSRATVETGPEGGGTYDDVGMVEVAAGTTGLASEQRPAQRQRTAVAGIMTPPPPAATTTATRVAGHGSAESVREPFTIERKIFMSQNRGGLIRSRLTQDKGPCGADGRSHAKGTNHHHHHPVIQLGVTLVAGFCGPRAEGAELTVLGLKSASSVPSTSTERRVIGVDWRRR
ncbi:hypothetical protein VaNZ11_009001 [Volvox africanus]|uniref:Guanylate-binding protein N-terminal domain-containing protein n=1 Tax=Volvox africanus TaxID=51714 RepID=A0ABQ5S6M7_9CHLO|nr:hypothetical protein VaNZ11_009001 [Volvox africanus]